MELNDLNKIIILREMIRSAGRQYGQTPNAKQRDQILDNIWDNKREIAWIKELSK